MIVNINTPVFQSKKKCHIITFQDTPSFEFVLKGASATPSKEELLENSVFIDFVDHFLEKASHYFSKALERKLFLHRITPIWDAIELPNKHQYFKVTWIPAEIHMYPSRYELHWLWGGISAVSFEREAGDAGDAGEAGEEEENTFSVNETYPGIEERDTINPQDATSVTVAATPVFDTREIDTETDIPLKEGSKTASKERLKQRVRQARLRIALAQLRAERLAEKYYRRYGNFEDVESGSDSDLSWEEDTGAT